MRGKSRYGHLQWRTPASTETRQPAQRWVTELRSESQQVSSRSMNSMAWSYLQGLVHGKLQRVVPWLPWVRKEMCSIWFRIGGNQLNDEKHRFKRQTTWVQMLSCLINFKILGKSLNLCKMEVIDKTLAYLIGLSGGLKVLLFKQYLEHWHISSNMC